MGGAGFWVVWQKMSLEKHVQLMSSFWPQEKNVRLFATCWDDADRKASCCFHRQLLQEGSPVSLSSFCLQAWAKHFGCPCSVSYERRKPQTLGLSNNAVPFVLVKVTMKSHCSYVPWSGGAPDTCHFHDCQCLYKYSIPQSKQPMMAKNKTPCSAHKFWASL